MINRIIDFSLDNRFLVLGLTLLLAAAGIHAARTNPVDAIPDISETQIIVFADWPGRSPQEVEDQVTYPMARQPAGAGRRQGGPLVVGLRLFHDQRDLRGRHGPLLRARRASSSGLNLVAALLPKGVTPMLGPDASARGPGLLVHAWKARARTRGSCARSRTGTSATS